MLLSASARILLVLVLYVERVTADSVCIDLSHLAK